MSYCYLDIVWVLPLVWECGGVSLYRDCVVWEVVVFGGEYVPYESEFLVPDSFLCEFAVECLYVGFV